jgi:glucose-6-phosphate isomerase
MLNNLFFQTDNDTTTRENAFASVRHERETIGYYRLPQQQTDAIEAYVEAFPQSVKTVAVIGIGGSALGAKAVYEFIRSTRELSRELCFFESTDPIHIQRMLEQIDLAQTHFIVISKSGTTIETMAIYKYILSLQSDPSRYTFVTDAGSPLDLHAKEKKASCFHLPENVGGRFSVLSVVGLLPLALCGIHTSRLLEGAAFIQKSFFEQGYMHDTLLKKAAYYTCLATATYTACGRTG